MDEIDLAAEREGRAIFLRQSYAMQRQRRRSNRQDIRRTEKDDLIEQIKWIQRDVQT